MIIVHGAEDGGPEVYVNPDKIVSILPNENGQTLLICQSQTKEGSIMIGTTESLHEVAYLSAAWNARPNELRDLRITDNFAVAVRLSEDGVPEYLNPDNAIIEGWE